MGESLSHVQRLPLRRLAAQQVVAKPDLPEAVLLAHNVFLNGHQMPFRPRRVSNFRKAGRIDYCAGRGSGER